MNPYRIPPVENRSWFQWAVRWIRENAGEIASLIIVAGLIIVFLKLIRWSDRREKEETEQTEHWKSAPCSEFANTAVMSVPLRCVPGYDPEER